MHLTQIITTLLICAICVVGGLFALLSNYKHRANRLIFYLTMATALSLPAQSIMEYIDPTRVVFWARYDSTATIILDALTVLVVCNFPRRLFGRKVEATFLLVSLAIAIVSFSPLMIAGGTSDGEVVKLVTGPGMPVFYVIDGIYTALLLPALILEYRRGRKLDKLRIKYLLLGIGIIVLLISIFGLWLPILFHIYGATNFIPFVILLGIAFILYDVVALHLLSIRLVVARSVAYIFLLICIAGGYYFLAFWVGEHIFGAIKISQADRMYQVVIAFTLAFLFQPVRRFFEKLTDRIFYKERYSTPKVVNDFSQILVSQRDIEPLLQNSMNFLCQRLHIGSGHIIAYENGRPLAAQHCEAAPPDDASMAAFLKFSNELAVAEYLPDDDERRAPMEKTHISVVAKLISHNEEVGILLLGEKLSSDIYSGQDISTLQIIRQELAVAVQNSSAYRNLQEAKAKLQKTDEMKSEFIALGSHYLRTPLTTIRMISEMMGTARSEQETARYTKMLSDVSNDLSSFVEELLIISTLEAGSQYSSFEVGSLQKILEPITQHAQSAAKAKGLNFTANFPTESLQIRGNTSHLQTAIRNLLDNAVKFTSSGGVTLSVTQEGGKGIVRVTDTGIGISQEELQNLFTKFHRGTDFEKYNYKGAGVGLYLAKLIAEEHGGQIAVNSQPQKGTTVTMELPLAILGGSQIQR